MGTKSEDLGDTTVKDNQITFDSKWSPPHLVIKELSKQFPMVKFCHTVDYFQAYDTEYNIWVNGENINTIEEETDNEFFTRVEEERQILS